MSSPTRSSWRHRTALLAVLAGAWAPRAAVAQCNVIAISAGTRHALALRGDREILAWGPNGGGQLGNGSTTWSGTPLVPFPKLLGPGPAFAQVTQVSANHVDDHGVNLGYPGFSLALTELPDGSVYAWGRNDNGELGDGSTTSRAFSARVKDVTGTGFLSGIAAVSAGGNHSLAVTPVVLGVGGNVYAWGSNTLGQLGNGTTTGSLLPVRVCSPGGCPGLLSNITAVDASEFFSLALRDDNTVWAWGSGFNGQLGNNSTGNSSLPVQVLQCPAPSTMCNVAGLTNITAIAAGDDHGLALDNTNLVWSWGNNQMSQLARVLGPCNNSPPTASLVAMRVCTGLFPCALTGVTKVAAGGFHSLALTGSMIRSWGWNSYGQLGNGSTMDSAVPVSVASLTNVTAISAGEDYSLALLADGTVRSWGNNDAGQLGTYKGALPLPVPIPTPTPNPPQTTPVTVEITLMDPTPPDQGNVLHAARFLVNLDSCTGMGATDVCLDWRGAPWIPLGVRQPYHDTMKTMLGITPLGPRVSALFRRDAGVCIPSPFSYYYQVKGLSPCTFTPGP